MLLNGLKMTVSTLLTFPVSQKFELKEMKKVYCNLRRSYGLVSKFRPVQFCSKVLQLNQRASLCFFARLGLVCEKKKTNEAKTSSQQKQSKERSRKQTLRREKYKVLFKVKAACKAEQKSASNSTEDGYALNTSNALHIAFLTSPTLDSY